MEARPLGQKWRQNPREYYLYSIALYFEIPLGGGKQLHSSMNNLQYSYVESKQCQN